MKSDTFSFSSLSCAPFLYCPLCIYNAEIRQWEKSETLPHFLEPEGLDVFAAMMDK
jgi:hypothetical protein